MVKVLIVEDDFMVADCLEEILKDAGHDVCGIAGTVEEAIALGDLHRPDIGVIDLRLAKGRSGTEVAAALRAHHHLGVLYATGSGDHEQLANAEGEGYISKPYTTRAMLAALDWVSARMSGPETLTGRRPINLAQRADW